MGAISGPSPEERNKLVKKSLNVYVYDPRNQGQVEVARI